MKIYVASSWRNPVQPNVVEVLRENGHEVYDFRNPRPGDTGFSWSQIDPRWESWSTRSYRDALQSDIAQAGFKSDFDAMKWADACVLVLPSGRSAHLEAGWMAGAGKHTVVYIPIPGEPELMNLLLGPICVSMTEVTNALASFAPVSA